MVQLTATRRIVAALEAVSDSQRSELNLPATLQLHEPITHEQLLRLAKHLQNDAAYQATTTTSETRSTVLNTLLHGTKVYIPPPPKKPEPSPEYLASKAHLLAEAEKAAYQRLLNPTYTPTPEHADPHASSSAEEDTLTPSLVFNIFLSVVITGFSVYWALTKFTMPAILARTFSSWTGPAIRDGEGGGGGGGASDAVRVLISFFAALAVAVAEAFLYGAYLEKVSRAKAREGRIRERKVFVGRVEGEGEGEKGGESVDVDGPVGLDVDEKEEIWGKGVNGGVRRRVREKWEKENAKENEG
ncbi:uncharacterized protein N7496_001595 [Penicillium cataractarum]|uniref:ATPase, vacuolar ER assembly factor, Vma12 n=1 Tax=Penicillium cataractarum TaxID=2100454 RepID=A0A9W9VWA5_9EURO|nr:uncharacterized protein N7496_001595 [Penicillium cataractarum]KAJ5390527.1 hypothetical protein N7496_001595 [Penicillium cataractarum]